MTRPIAPSDWLAPVRLLLAFSILLIGIQARAADQGPYSAGVYSEGPGFRLGSAPLVIHPGLSVELGYDSNVFYRPPSQETGSGLLRLRAHLDMATLPPQSLAVTESTADPKVEFRLSTQLEYREYLSDNAAVREQRSLNVILGTQLVILPKGLFSLTISDAFARTVDPRNSEGRGQFSRDHNRLGLLGTFHRGGLEVGIGDSFEVDFWEDQDLKFGNNYSNDALAFAKLRILPQTIGQVSVRAGYVYYTDRDTRMVPVRVMLGASTLFARWFGASVNLGYGNSINNRGPSFNSAIANLQARFLLPKQMGLTLTYDRDFDLSLFANYFTDDHLWLAYELPFLNGVTIRLDGGVHFRRYEGLVDPSVVSAWAYNSNVRDDRIWEVHAELRYRATSWLQIGAVYNLLIDDTRFQFITESMPMPPGMPVRFVNPVNYIKHTVLAMADFAY